MLGKEKLLSFKIDIIWLIVFVFCLASIHFFAPVAYVNKKILIAIELGSILLMFMFSGILERSHQKTIFGNSLRLFLFVIIFSATGSFFVYGQSFIDSFRVIMPLLTYSLYFFLQKFSFNIKKLENIVLLICFLYLLSFLFALYKAPEQIFGLADAAILDQRGIYRVRVEGRGFLHLAFFIVLNRYIVTNKIKWLLFSLILLAFVFAHVIRQYVLFSLLFGGIMLFINISWKKKIYITISLFLIISISINLPVVEALIDLTQRQLNKQSYGEDIRVTAYKFFFNDYSKHLYTDIFGSGIASGTGKYNYYVQNYVNKYLHIYHSDVGYGYSYANFGFISLIILCVIFVKSLFNKPNKEALYAKYFILFAFCSNILSSYMFSSTSYTAICLSLFIFDAAKNKKLQLKEYLNERKK